LNHSPIALFSAALILALTAESSFCADIVIHAGALIDGTGAAPRQKVSISIHDDKITAVEDGFKSPAGAQVIDLSGATVLPGFIDCHVHVTAMLPSRTNSTEYWVTHSDIDRAFDAEVFVRQMLQQGFTSARDVGGGDETVALRNAIDAGKIPGPRPGDRPRPCGRCVWVRALPSGRPAGLR
jgi:imidazolonepropionase-like amidohydrolase